MGWDDHVVRGVEQCMEESILGETSKIKGNLRECETKYSISSLKFPSLLKRTPIKIIE